MKQKRVRRILALALAAAVLASVPAPYAEAATKKVKTMKSTWKVTSTLKKKAITVKKGTTTLKVKSTGYVKFKVPKTRKYTFTFSKMTSSVSGMDFNNGFSYIDIPKSSYGGTYLEHQKFSTTGGKATTAWYHTTKYASTEKTIYAAIAKRSCKLKLKKGTTVYIFFNFAHAGKVNLKIK